MACPLCKSERKMVVERIETRDIIKLYESKYGINIGYLCKGNTTDYLACDVCKLGYFSPPTIGDEKFYTHFQKYPWYYMDDKYEFSYAARFIKASDKILEVGSGKGALVKFLPTKNYTGLEYSQSAKEIAAANGIQIENESVKAHALKNKEAYDVVCHFQVLEHIEHVASFLQASVDCLKKGGRLIISVPSQDSFLSFIINGYLNLPPHHASRWSDDTFKYIQKMFNLEIEELHHEKLAGMHEMMFVRAQIENAIRSKLGLQYKLVDVSGKQKIIKYISFILGYFLKNKLIKNASQPAGHSVVVVYKKL